MTTSGRHPLVRELPVQVAAAGATADAAYVVKVPFTGVISAVTYSTVTAITGAATNNRAVSVTNKGTDGSGTTTVASLTFASGVNTVAYVEKAITLSATAADLAVTAGDILSVATVHAGTGIADPGGTVVVELSAD